MVFSGLSIVAWVLNWLCWTKKFCCCKLYHNPIITRIFWWLSFSFLSGLIACCISGLVFATRFGKYIRVVQCAYERIYYDSEYGELKDSYPKWEGLISNAEKLNSSKILLDNIPDILLSFPNGFLKDEEWKSGIKIEDPKLEFKGINYVNYIDQMEKFIKNSIHFNQTIYYGDDKIFFDCQKIDNPDSLFGKYLYEETKFMNTIYEKFELLYDSILSLKENEDYCNKQINDSINNFKETSKDLKNYKNGYLSKVEYYIKVGKGCGYILVIIYFSLLSIISICGCFLLLVYTYLSNQGNLEKLMHIIWNSIRFFSFSFLMYAAAFGMLFKGLRDLISYNMFLFGINLIESTSYVLPQENAKKFLNLCLNEENSEFNGQLEDIISNDLDTFFSNYEEIDILLEKQKSINNFFQEDIGLYLKNQLLRNMEIESSLITEETSYIIISETTTYNDILIEISNSFFNLQKEHEDIFNKINSTFTETKNKIKLNDNYEFNKVSLSKSNPNSNSYNCGFLKSDLNLLYNSLYDLSVESRILFIISCCIGFFGEALIYFYLLSMYHYNNTEFKEGNLDLDKTKIRSRNNIEEGSRNEFLDKNKPANMRKFNKYLDKDFNKDFSTSVRKGLK